MTGTQSHHRVAHFYSAIHSSWTIGICPDSDLVNMMMDAALERLDAAMLTPHRSCRMVPIQALSHFRQPKPSDSSADGLVGSKVAAVDLTADTS